MNENNFSNPMSNVFFVPHNKNLENHNWFKKMICLFKSKKEIKENKQDHWSW